MLQEPRFSTGENQQEIIPMDLETFPCVCMLNHLDRYPDKTISWHWHKVFEIDLVVEGAMTLETPEQTNIIRKGEAIFINYGILHRCSPASEESCVYYTILFDMRFLSGMYNSIFESKYFVPVLHCDSLPVWTVEPDSHTHLKMLEAVMRAIEAAREEPFGYEFDIRGALTDFWRLFLLETEDVRASDAPKSSVDTERIKVMMRFIGEHYEERITIDDIAAVAGISARECTRCFRRCISSTPNIYLTQTRVRKAAELLTGSSKSVIEISEECGFSSSSYFGKVFREMMGVTPKDYRKGITAPENAEESVAAQ